MAMGEEQPPPGDAYVWDDSKEAPAEVRKLWGEVALGIDKSQTVVWKNAVESLQSANKHLASARSARTFVETYMKHIIGILVEQQPAKIGQHERTCVEDSLELAVMIIAKDLKIQQKRKGESLLLEVLASVFNRKKSYYKGSKGWNANHLSGLPEVRLRMIDAFRQQGGFSALAEYLSARIQTPIFPSLESLHQILNAIADAVPSRAAPSDAGIKEMEDDAILVGQAAMNYISSISDESMRKLQTDMLNTVRYDLQRIFDRLVSVRRDNTYQFYAFWRNLVLLLISSQSLPLRLFGWEQLKELIDASQEHRPPPRAFMVSGAGCVFVNGMYTFAGDTTVDGYSQRGVEISYERSIPPSEKDGAGKHLTLFRCTMRSQQKWWFLSEADEEQPGTDRDIDYYQHKSKEHEETEPPPAGWVTCRNAGIEPPPRLKGMGLMVPAGQEYNTLEHQLAKWAIENKIVELVLGASLHREVVHRSIPFIEFLAQMCNRDAPAGSTPACPPGPNAYCLQKSHLLLAWRTCSSKSDAAVSDEIYHLLVSILPSLPDDLAKPLLQAVQETLFSGKRGESIMEVGEFCVALASHSPADLKDPSSGILSDEVRAVVLDLLWAVLTHPDASSLKSYDALKRYVMNELRVEPLGRKHREKFLSNCTQTLSKNSKQHQGGGRVDEVLALRMVKLTHFVLEACPRDQAEEMVADNKGILPSLIFSELTAYLARRKEDIAISPANKKSQTSEPIIGASPLSERLRILRCVYGISEKVKLSVIQLHHLWDLCVIPADREELMVFVASASTVSGSSGGSAPVAPDPPQSQQKTTPPVRNDALTAAFSDDVRATAFVDLMCSKSVDWDVLGESAYQSFQLMYKRLRQKPGNSSRPALNALWRICLTTGDENVASLSMKDLLAVYAAMAAVNANANNAWAAGPPKGDASDDMQTDDDSNDFGDRIFDCLVDVKQRLDAGDASSERSAERCLRILNAAVGQDGSNGRSVTTSAINLLASTPPDATLADVIGLLPHGMRGQSGYRRISIMAKRTASHQNQNVMQDVQGSTTQRQGSTSRFSIDVHPLETLGSVKVKVAHHCLCRVSSVKPISASGRLAGSGNRAVTGDSSQMSLNVVPDDSTVDQLGIIHGCEMVFVIADRVQTKPASQPKLQTPKSSVLDLNEIFSDNNGDGFANKIFQTLLSVLEALPWRSTNAKPTKDGSSAYNLVWDLMLAMPTNSGVAEKVRSTAGVGFVRSNQDAVMADSSPEQWPALLDKRSYQRSVYVLQTIDSFLQPAPEILSSLTSQKQGDLDAAMKADALAFRRGFIESGGFAAVVSFFAASTNDQEQSQKRMGDSSALRILKCCLFGNSRFSTALENPKAGSLDEMGQTLLNSLSNKEGLLRTLTSMVVADEGISTSTISDVIKFLRLLLVSPNTTELFVGLPDRMAERFLITLLLWEGASEAKISNTAVGTSSKVRKNMHDLILSIPLLARHALPWLIGALDNVDVNSDATADYFDVLKKLVCADDEVSQTSEMSMRASEDEFQALGTAVCRKLTSCPRPTSDSSVVDATTGVLCGCLKLLRALIENVGGGALATGTGILLADLNLGRWSEFASSGSWTNADQVLVDLMGAVFDGFLSPGGSSSVVSICCDKESRQLGFDAVAAAARSCSTSQSYLVLVRRISEIQQAAAPYLRHRWGQVGSSDDGHGRSTLRNPSKYSGLRNQGCTCYMNSFLQQLFMMNDLRKEMCAAPLPESLRSSGGGAGKGNELVGKKLSFQWDSGASYEALVEKFDDATGMHTVRYCPLLVATVAGNTHQQVTPEDVARLPPELPDEFILSEGRPGKETGVFEVVTTKPAAAGESSGESSESKLVDGQEIRETEDEANARHLFEEVQRTFIHLDEGSRGRCFDPRAFVEACACLKLEFDVWQQNDASEFAMKLLDRMEIALKRWAPQQFRYLEHAFGLKQTKQKVCKECGLKTNREENLMSIDCQIRGKCNIQEALETMCEVEYMEGNNKVFCDRCKKNTDTVLRTAISALPDMLILSLKRFDLDYNTFETVKLNSRCAFGQTLNMKRYTLDGVEAMEKAASSDDGVTPMDTSDDGAPPEGKDPLVSLPDDDYEYKLAGVLVHAGVAQGGHYYSFIKDRSSSAGDKDKWYKFDDEDVTPFDSSTLEQEAFGGKVKKDTRWPNGQVHTVESEQFANALMLFYEKVKPTELPAESKEEQEDKDIVMQRVTDMDVPKTTGFEMYEPDVRRSNATHKWQTFLFDSEFQTFLKGLLGLCRLSRNHKSSKSSDGVIAWQATIVDMLLTFFFDVLLYSADKSSLNVWVSMLSDTLSSDKESSKHFIRKLAAKTETVSANWLRTYVAECPDPESRRAAVRIFAAALRSCAKSKDELESLTRWRQAWKAQLLAFKQNLGQVALPTTLQGSWKVQEDIRTLGTPRSSSIGVIISYINVLLEVAPRTWRYNSELCMLIRDVALGGSALCGALNDTHVPGRMICLVVREKAPLPLRISFPGATMSYDLVDSQTRQETNPTAYLLPMGSTQTLHNEMNNRGPSGGSPVASDFITLFEALGIMNGMKSLVLTPLVIETGELSRSRSSFVLTDAAANAMSTIFQESCSSGEVGMSQQDIESYLHLCGLDSSSVPTQKILDIMTKYPSTIGTGTRSGKFSLSLEGFLAYYRDTAQTNEERVRSDLHTFGYRPDLSRRPEETRIEVVEGRRVLRPTVSSVCIDVQATLSEDSQTISELALLGFGVFELHAYAYCASEPLAEYLLASTSISRDTTVLIKNTQRAIARAPTAWAGNEMWAAATMIFRVLASIDDPYQKERVALIMNTSRKEMQNEQEVGLLPAAKALANIRASPDYSSNEIQYSYERYVELLKELMKLHPVAVWMADHRALWSWMERDLVASEEGPSQRRGDYSGRREGDNPRSDSDMQGIHDSEDSADEDDSPMYDIADKVVVHGAGLDVINGVYRREGYFDSVGKYVKKGKWKDTEETFSMFRCQVSNNTQHWYISIVPPGVQPGTNTDIDFYSAPVSTKSRDHPPSHGWTSANEGVSPPPMIQVDDAFAGAEQLSIRSVST